MARKKSNNGKAAAARIETHFGPGANPGWFTWFAWKVAHIAGKPAVFLTALAAVVAWAITGPIFGYSDTWQLIINTATTIITFLMVFLIQNTQNRDTMALQVKLDELIFVMRGAQNRIAGAEDMSDEELERLHEQYRKRADQALASLNDRRSITAEREPSRRRN